MTVELIEWQIQELRSEHVRAEFSCGHESLDNYLKKQATQHKNKGISKTFVATKPGDLNVCGYYSLATGSVNLQDLTDAQKKGLPSHPIPVAMLGRLAVTEDMRRNGLGEFLLLDAMRRVLLVGHEIGIHAIEVDAIDDTAKKFYLKYDFTELADDPRHLYIPIAKIHKLNLL